jgi:hypothetical protein
MLTAQVFEVNGGASSIYQAEGGNVTMHAPSLDASIGAGLLAGQFVGGFNLTKKTPRSTYLLGDDYIPFVLPTDIFDTSHYLVALGAGIQTRQWNTDIFAFGGAVSNDFSSPYFDGVRAESPAGILFLDKKLQPHLSVSSKMVFSTEQTAIASLDWKPETNLDLAASGGVGANSPYGAASLKLTRKLIDLQAAYIQAGAQFHRLAIQLPILSEPNRENIVLTLRPFRFLSLTGARQNFLTPLNNSANEVQSTLNQGSAGLLVAGTNLSASIYRSSYQNNFDLAEAYTLDRAITSRAHANLSYFESRPSNGTRTREFVANLMQQINPRLGVTEVISEAQGQSSVSFGGELLTNLLAISAEYQTYYVPIQNSTPFQEAMILDVQLHLFRGITLHGGTYVGPDGSLEYTADGTALAVHESNGSNNGGILAGNAIGSKVIRGRVTDPQGHPVSGAAIMLDQLIVYTDDDGLFTVRERKIHTHRLKVMTDKFLDGSSYQVVSAPDTVKSAEEGNEKELLIVVKPATN